MDPYFRPRVLHVVHSLSAGGMERNLLATLEHPSLRRFDHVVCTLRSAGPLAGGLARHVQLISLDAHGRRLGLFLKLARILRMTRPQLVHARNFNTWTDCIAARLASRLSVQTLLGFHGVEHPGGFTRAQVHRARWMGMRRREFVSVSQSGARDLERQLGVPSYNIHVIPNGVDAERFRPPDQNQKRSARQALEIDPDTFAVVMVGSLTPAKNHLLALDVLQRLTVEIKSVTLIVAGDGPLRDALAQRANALGLDRSLRWLGAVRDVRPVLHAGDLFLLTSSTEQMNNALLEAMATALPAVVTDVGDNRDVIEQGQSGYVVAPTDADEMVRAVRSAADQPDWRRDVGFRARKAVANRFQFDMAVHRYLNLYERLIHANPERSISCAASPA